MRSVTLPEADSVSCGGNIMSYHISHLLDAKLLTEAAPTSLAMETPEPKSSPDSPPPHSATMALLGVRSDSEESLSDDESRLSDGDPWCLAATSHPSALNPFGIRLPWCLIPKSSCNPVDGRAIGRWSLTSTHFAGLARDSGSLWSQDCFGQ